jgi:hypothetical protein
MAGSLSAPVEQGKPRLLDQVRNVIRIKHYSIRTEEAYVDWRVRLRRRAKDPAFLFTMHYVYVLRSASDDGFYIGYSANLLD